MFEYIKLIRPVFSGVPFALLYGALARLIFNSQNSDWFTSLSIAFLFFVPIVIGALTVYFAPESLRTSLGYAILMPWVSCFIAGMAASLLALEASICILMAMPILCIMSSIGGVVVCLNLRLRKESSNPKMLGVILLVPYLFVPIEILIPNTDSIRTVHTQIEINASEATVWQKIARISKIQDHERQYNTFFHWFGMPQPIEATLSYEGIGADRMATFVGGMAFVETVIEWQPQKAIAYTITPDTRAVLAAPWNEVGGKHFNVTGAGYRIERVKDGKVILHLTSQSRLSTRFNVYGGWWTDAIMADIQNYILRVIKSRAEVEK